MTKEQLNTLISQHQQETGKPALLTELIHLAGFPAILANMSFGQQDCDLLQQCDLAGLKFRSCHFSEDFVYQKPFDNCQWQQCQFTHSLFNQGVFHHCQFTDCDFKEPLFVNSQLDHTIFDQCQIKHASFEDAAFSQTTFHHCRLPGSHFLGSTATHTSFHNCDLRNTHFFGAEKKHFQIDRTSQQTLRHEIPSIALPIYPKVRGVSTPRLHRKLLEIAHLQPLKIAVESPQLPPAIINAEVNQLLRERALSPDPTLSIPRQILQIADQKPDHYPQLYGIIQKAKHIANAISGLVLSGGEDVPPPLYGQDQSHEQTYWGDDYRRSMLEIALLREAISRGIPVMAICRGFQLLNVYHGTALLQHIGNDQRGIRTLPVSPAPRSQAGLFGHLLDNLTTAVYHHQAVPREPYPARGLEAASHDDRWILATESAYSGAAPLIGLQFHPEFYQASEASSATENDTVSTQRLVADRSATQPHDQGLQNPSELVSRGLTTMMSQQNDRIWSVFSESVGQAFHKKAAVRSSNLSAIRHSLKPVP